jgi:hypothetical protein
MRDSLRTFTAGVRSRAEQEEQAARRSAADFDRLKTYGRCLIPFGIPDHWRAKVIKRLEEAIAPGVFPSGLPFHEEVALVRAEVEEVLNELRAGDPLEDGVEGRVRRCTGLREFGEQCAEGLARNLPHSETRAFMEEVRNLLRIEVGPEWTERDVESLVEEIYDDWEYP